MDNIFKKANIFLSVIVITLVSIVLLSTIVKEGMFMDGLIYSTISRNMSLGIGSLWHPKFSETIMSTFNGHPPLVFGIQSLFFSILGTSIYTERFYSFLTAMITLYMISKIWKLLYKNDDKYLWWYPVFLWMATPVVFWTYSNNMLECTMGVFTIIAVYFSIKFMITEQKNKYLYAFLISISIVLGVLSKGLPALFPLVVIGIYWIVYKRPQFVNVLISSFGILFAVITILYILLLNNDVYNYLSAYIDLQVLGSISGKINPGSRMFIVIRLMRELLSMIIVSILIISIGSKFRLKLILKSFNNKLFLFFILIGLSASLPITISPKQMGFYLVPAFPFFALAFASISFSFVNNWLQKINNLLVLKALIFVFITALLIVIYTGIGKYSRDKEVISDVKEIGKIIPKNTIVSIHTDFYKNWGFISYMYRYNFISIDRVNTDRTYYLMTKGKQIPKENYKRIDLTLNKFDLYEKVQK